MQNAVRLFVGEFRHVEHRAVGGVGLATAVLFKEQSAFALQNDGGEGIAREALDAVHGNRKDRGRGEARFLRGRLHHRGGDDPARERRQARDDEFAFHEEGADEVGEAAHASEPEDAQDDGAPLGEKRFETDHRPHVGDDEHHREGVAKRHQVGFGDEFLGDDRPVADEEDDGGNEDGRHPRLCEFRYDFADEDDGAADDECGHEVVHDGESLRGESDALLFDLSDEEEKTARISSL